jgi:hypothetical protein
MQNAALGQKERPYELGVGTVEFEMTGDLQAIAAQNSAAIEQMMHELTNKAHD